VPHLSKAVRADGCYGNLLNETLIVGHVNVDRVLGLTG